MSSEIAISVKAVSKHHLMFNRPEDRLKQMVVPRLQRLVRQLPRRYFRDFAALTNISLDVRRGETVGIIGRNGSGKSTLLQIICGTLQPTSGSVTVNGRVAALLELGAGFNPDFTGRENAYLNASILGLSRAEMDNRFDSIASFADIGDFIEQPVKTYSSGMYVRLAFAVAINVDPDILVVDEALSVGDEAFSRKCFARIEQIRERGGTILFVSHAAQTIVQLCDRAVLLDAGEIMLTGRPKTVTGQYQRLVNASAEGAAEIRAQIVAMRDATISPTIPIELPWLRSESEDEVVVENSQAPTNEIKHSEALSKQLECADGFDPSLVSKSTAYQEERGARIRDVRILTVSGEQVNVLRLGRRYFIEYWTDFSTDATRVGFGIGITTTTGFHVAGAKCRASRVELAQAGSSLRSRFEFTSLLLPGHYFVTCQVRGLPEVDEVPLHRIIDAIAFRVVEEDETLAAGLVDLSMVVTVDR
ncbi:MULTISPECIES: ABC transporter ATP-binding protein [unclassified Mesorhizobium]|uniref:ABC transporter ATP-binding protein n=1 Tax=unclassified Mesorhizobium TaxID=325217 RepID=UPI0003CF9952|nr:MULTISPECIES: ABC transporter ATP-binding protein [unclassified Mesorhizobium]ESY53106.1 ABC transporter ATP-binding protein [Mesorhizobium sp. LNJC374B00]ESY59716.1 ABC transporter ATP-binding protein [Mesorhizobium sp. LNJC372A00]WJI80291.1 ABC transporter ATP-binding protein [Mesorhizobium sp. C374B]WJI86828.1 ABC transporter ATP-binding protein [Mesorhizobium sp. C372A]